MQLIPDSWPGPACGAQAELRDPTAPSPLAPQDSGLTVAQHRQQIQQRLERSST
eukprot:COSAG01_NODE_48587_length_379_cov_5.314286_2_plen_53_part_01